MDLPVSVCNLSAKRDVFSCAAFSQTGFPCPTACGASFVRFTSSETLLPRAPSALPPSALPALSELFLDRVEVAGVALPSAVSLLATGREEEFPATFAVLVFISDSHTGGLYNGDFGTDGGGVSASSSRLKVTGAGVGVGVMVVVGVGVGVMVVVGVGLGGVGLSISLLLESRTMLELRRGRKPMGA